MSIIHFTSWVTKKHDIHHNPLVSQMHHMSWVQSETLKLTINKPVELGSHANTCCSFSNWCAAMKNRNRVRNSIGIRRKDLCPNHLWYHRIVVCDILHHMAPELWIAITSIFFPDEDIHIIISQYAKLYCYSIKEVNSCKWLIVISNGIWLQTQKI